MENGKKYLMVIFNEKNDSHYIYSGFDNVGYSEIKDILDFLNISYVVGEIIENTYKEK